MIEQINPVVDALARAHAELHGVVQDVEQMLKSSDRSRADLGAALQRLRDDWVEHVHFEEQGGYMEAVLAKKPNLERTVRHLLAEHAAMIRALDDVVRDAKAIAVEDASLRGKVSAWLATMRQHESKENTLVEETFSLDTGVED